MGKLSNRDAGIIARQLCADWNRDARAENKKAEQKELEAARASASWRKIVSTLGLESTDFDDLDYNLRNVFREHVLPVFTAPVRVYEMTYTDALRLVEFHALTNSTDVTGIMNAAKEAWKNEQY
jgi:hypothetical protein